jgi:hypothetical protein
MSQREYRQLIDQWRDEKQRPFSGWDFSYLEGRMIEEQPPWSYSARAAELMRGASAVVDMGTGGGERFLKLRESWPKKVVVTEEYPPNFRLATARLAPLGVDVIDVHLTTHDPMPFADGEFDLVLNRHSAFNPREVARILAMDGRFLTQQVHGLWAHDLLAAFDAHPQWPEATPETHLPQLQAAGFIIETSEAWSGNLTFTDVAAIVYYLRAVPWLVPDFSVNRHLPYLLNLQRRVDNGESLTFFASKYRIEARKIAHDS